MIAFDTTYLMVILYEKTPSISDRNGRLVSRPRERVQYLIQKLSENNSIVCIPTPVLTEIMVHAGKAGPEWLKRLSDASKFKLSPFDVRAAIEAAELIRKIKDEQRAQPIKTWAKARFDVQIVSIAKAEKCQVIYSEDHDMENHGRRAGIEIRRICDLPLPPEKEDEAPLFKAIGQGQQPEAVQQPEAIAKIPDVEEQTNPTIAPPVTPLLSQPEPAKESARGRLSGKRPSKPVEPENKDK